ncbi:STT3 domain-containing protein [Methanobrevibacter sp.]|uniref:STT3 domain-containing protein n=1 Tax=Methanobrevibacter sp. TaxID=66852 RepID=UPI003869201B
MNRQTILTISKSIIIILILLAFVFALKVPAADLPMLSGDTKDYYTDDSGLPYFSEMDSYYNLRLTENFVDHGHVGDEIINGSAWDMHRYAPDGNEISYEYAIVYVTSWIHDLANNFLGHDYSVKEVAFWTGAIISTFAVIPAFIFSRRITNDYGAIVATLIIVLAPNYFAHTFPGFFDTDMFYYIFPLFFIFFFVEALRTDNMILKVVYAVLSILAIGLFSFSWTGYIFYVGLMGVFAVAYLIACYFFNIGDDQDNYSSKLDWFIHNKDLLTIIIIGVIGFVFLGIFKGFDGIIGIFSSLTGLLNLQSASVVVGGFPNVLISVAEMQMPSLLGKGMTSAFLANTGGVVNGMGGIAVLFAGLIVLYVLVSRSFKYRSVKASKGISGKPQKGDRLSASKKIDNDRKFKISLSDLKFGGDNDILSDKRLTVMYATLFVVWIVIAALAVSRGSRFITTIVLPFALLTGIFVSYAGDYIKNRLNDDRWLVVILFLCGFLVAIPLSTINVIYAIAAFLVIVAAGLFTIYGMKSDASVKVPIKKTVVIIAIVLALIMPSVCGAYLTSETVVPGTNDGMWNAMQWIDGNQTEDTVITSWWDFGYLFEIAADRQVTFDGGSQTGSRAFWLGKSMTTDDLELSAGIYRMLDSSGERAVNKLVNVTGDTGKSVDMLIDILPKTASDAQKTLVDKYHISEADAKEVVSYTHPENPRPVTFVASADMLQKAGWWTYFGAWNFENQTSQNYNYYIPTEGSGEIAPGSSANVTVLDSQGLKVNAVIERGTGNNTTNAHVECVNSETNEKIMVNDTEYNPLKASNIILVEDNILMKNESIKGCEDGNFTLFLMGNENQYTPILMSHELVNSMFTRLYLFGGAGQDIFSLEHSESGVMLFKVNFENTVAGGASGNSTN